MELDKKLAEIHAQAVIDYIRHLSCPKKQKAALLKAILNADKTTNGCK